jgi:hypothetical protein
MFTQAMPSLAQSLQGALPQAAVRQLMQVLGNCNQPLQHRGPLSVSPALNRREVTPGVFGGDPSWPPEIVNMLTNTNNIFNNQSFVDGPSYTSNNFAGDQFLFNNAAEFITNNFPVTVVMGQPGTPGLDGRDGLAGVNGANGISGMDGVPGVAGVAGAAGSAGAAGVAGAAGLNGFDGIAGVNGLDGPPGALGAAGAAGLAGQAGRDGAAGRAGAAGVAGAAGRDGQPGPAGPAGLAGRDGLDGLAGPPGLPGRDANVGNLKIVPGGQRYPVGEFLTGVTVSVRPGSKISIPKYDFDANSCSLVPAGTEEVDVTIDLDVTTESEKAGFFLPTFTIQGA